MLYRLVRQRETCAGNKLVSWRENESAKQKSSDDSSPGIITRQERVDRWCYPLRGNAARNHVELAAGEEQQAADAHGVTVGQRMRQVVQVGAGLPVDSYAG
jgi:hypothetical protein